MTIKKSDIPTTWRANLGTFSKAVSNSISLNFSESGSVNCHNSCKMKHNGCYAVHTEKMKPSIAISGERKRVQGVIQTCLDYLNQLERMRDNAIQWARFSTFGSVPNSLTATQKAVFTRLLAEVARTAQAVHFPVETENKRSLYQALCDDNNINITVRLSAQTLPAFKRALASNTAASFVFCDGESKKQRLYNAEIFVSALDNVIVCPAIRSTISKTDKVKCGNCTACSNPQTQVVYPKH